MTKMKNILIFLMVTFFSCNYDSKKVLTESEVCDIERIYSITDEYLRKKKYDLKQLDKTMVNSSKSKAVVTYKVQDSTLVFGGGAEIVFDLLKCEIVSANLYQ